MSYIIFLKYIDNLFIYYLIGEKTFFQIGLEKYVQTRTGWMKDRI